MSARVEMETAENTYKGWKWITSLRACLWLWIPIALISFFHYSTMSSHVWLHDIYRRLYYIPIILGAFGFGLKGGLSASLVTSLAYAPHAFMHYFVHDPAASIEKFLEIVLYNIVAVIAGYLAQKEHMARLSQEAISLELANTLEENKLLHDQLIQAGKLKALGELTAGIAHEIKNPLASIQGAAEAIADEIPDSSPRKKLVEIQKKELNRLTNTLERFISFARPSKFLISDIDLCDLVTHVVDLVAPQASKKSIELTPICTEVPAMVQGDRDQLTQVLVNLVINASNAMDHRGSIKLNVGTDTIGKKKFMVVDVIDSGPGIPEKIREKIFDPFFSTKDDGTGLGLSISTNIVTAHGGFIRVRPGPEGVGSCFSVYLPAASQS